MTFVISDYHDSMELQCENHSAFISDIGGFIAYMPVVLFQFILNIISKKMTVIDFYLITT
jgi:hypothetical protein